MKSNELDMIYLLNKDRNSKKNKKGRGKGCFGGKNRYMGDYKTLKVIPKSERNK